MSCAGPTILDVHRSLAVLGVIVVHLRCHGGQWHAELATDDGHTRERHDTLLGDALQAATNAVVTLRMEQRRAALADLAAT